MKHGHALFLLVAALCCAACSNPDKPLNPSFPLRLDEAKAELRAMKDDPKDLDRPVVVSDGYFSPGISAARVASKIEKYTGDDRVIQSVYFSTGTFDSSRERLISKIEERFPSDNPNETVEVDVVAISMGGLVARYAALPRTDGGKRLNLRRLYALGTPHIGAEDAEAPTLDKRVLDMRAGSDFLTNLNAALPDAEYEMVNYVRLGDDIVEEYNAAPPGETAYWVANKPFSGAHLGVAHDERFLADILRRLRGEKPYTVGPPAPLPDFAQAPVKADKEQ
ncbi:MAG: hypothetical protein AAFX05_05580 [Planctomycetota bacterium]